MAVQTRPFDPQRYLQAENDQREYLSQVFADGDFSEMADAMMLVAQVRGLDAVADRARTARDAGPGLTDIRDLLAALNLRLDVGSAFRQAA